MITLIKGNTETVVDESVVDEMLEAGWTEYINDTIVDESVVDEMLEAGWTEYINDTIVDESVVDDAVSTKKGSKKK